MVTRTAALTSARFVIYGTLPGLNEYTDANRSHRQVGAAMKRNAEAVVGLYAASARLGRFDGPVRLTFDWYEPTAKRDPDNVVFAKKFILDALVARGTLPGDGRRHVVGFADRVSTDRQHPRVVVTIERTGDG